MTADPNVGPCALPGGNMIIEAADGGGTARVLPKLSYALTPPISSSEQLVVAKYVASTRWVSGDVVVRVHAVSLANNQSIDVEVRNVSYAAEDPSTDFVEAGTTVASASLTAGTNAGDLLLGSFSAPIAAQLQVALVFNQDLLSLTTLACTIGVDLVGRTS